MADVLSGPVLVKDAARGRPPVELRRVAWEGVSRGLYVPRTEHTAAQVAAAVALVLPGTVASVT